MLEKKLASPGTGDGIATATDDGSQVPAVGRFADRLLLRGLHEGLCRLASDRLQIVLPSGAAAFIGPAEHPCSASMQIRSYRALWRIARGGALGFAECFMDGDVTTGDLKALFEFCLKNERALMAALPQLYGARERDRLWHKWKRNTRAGSRRNIAAHYDLGNAFYAEWLDAGMIYSSAIFDRPGMSLEEAQGLKVERILSALELSEGHRLLEIGCGWGALAVAAARRGAVVDAITISSEQLDATLARIDREGMAARARARFTDYRDTAGTFDRVVSVEMIEAVGEEHWPTYFATIADRLGRNGVAVLQAITIREDTFEHYRRNPDFIQRYVFPGGMLPTIGLMQKNASAAGLTFEIVERFGQSYALTLSEWRARFEAAWPRLSMMGFDERFRRTWLYYLIYCEVGFANGLIDVGLYRLRKG